MKMDISSNVKLLLKKMNRVQDKIPMAVMRALNRVGDGLETEAYRKTKKKYVLKRQDMKKYGNLKVKKTDVGKLKVSFTSKGNMVALPKFRINQKNSAVAYKPKILRASVYRQRVKPIPDAFVATMKKSGHIGVFTREGKKRLPIEQKFGPAVPIILSQKPIIEQLYEEAEQRMDKRLTHEIGRLIGGWQKT